MSVRAGRFSALSVELPRAWARGQESNLQPLDSQSITDVASTRISPFQFWCRGYGGGSRHYL